MPVETSRNRPLPSPEPVCGRPFDFGNSRWGSEPSEAKRRHKRVKSLVDDDAWTGTYMFLSRAALFHDEFAESGGGKRSCRSRGQHRLPPTLARPGKSVLVLHVPARKRFQRSKRVKDTLTGWLRREKERIDQKNAVCMRVDRANKEITHRTNTNGFCAVRKTRDNASITELIIPFPRLQLDQRIGWRTSSVIPERVVVGLSVRLRITRVNFAVENTITTSPSWNWLAWSMQS